MFAYNPGVNDQSGQLIAQGAQNAAAINAQMMSDFGENIGNAIAQIGNAYSERKQLEAKASSYDDIGKILGTAMFNNNADAIGALGNLQKEKDPRKKVMGYEQLFSMVGPMSNAMMARSRLGVQQQGQQLATDRMYTLEQLRREREMMNKPQASNSTFTGGSLLRGLFQPMPTSPNPGP